MNDIKLMNKAADNIRILAASMVEKAKSGHPGGAMGGADFVNVLFSEFLVYDPKNPAWEGRDRYFQDPGHMSPMLYSVLALAGKFTIDELKEFRQWGSVTPGHPEVNVMRGIENTSGPLGQGHTYAVGAAIAAKFLKARLGDVMNQTIYTYISDGGIQEEISQGAGRIAGTLGLDNLIMFYDANNIQLSTTVGEVTTENVAMKYEASRELHAPCGHKRNQLSLGRGAGFLFQIRPIRRIAEHRTAHCRDRMRFGADFAERKSDDRIHPFCAFGEQNDKTTLSYGTCSTFDRRQFR